MTIKILTVLIVLLTTGCSTAEWDKAMRDSAQSTAAVFEGMGKGLQNSSQQPDPLHCATSYYGGGFAQTTCQ